MLPIVWYNSALDRSYFAKCPVLFDFWLRASSMAAAKLVWVHFMMHAD